MRSADSIAIPGGVKIFQDRQTLRAALCQGVERLVPRPCAVRSDSAGETPGTTTRRPGGPLDSAMSRERPLSGTPKVRSVEHNATAGEEQLRLDRTGETLVPARADGADGV